MGLLRGRSYRMLWSTMVFLCSVVCLCLLYVCLCQCRCLHVGRSLCVLVPVLVSVFVCVSVFVSVPVSACLCVGVCGVWVWGCVCTCVCVCLYVHIGVWVTAGQHVQQIMSSDNKWSTTDVHPTNPTTTNVQQQCSQLFPLCTCVQAHTQVGATGFWNRWWSFQFLKMPESYMFFDVYVYGKLRWTASNTHVFPGFWVGGRCASHSSHNK